MKFINLCFLTAFIIRYYDFSPGIEFVSYSRHLSVLGAKYFILNFNKNKTVAITGNAKSIAHASEKKLFQSSLHKVKNELLYSTHIIKVVELFKI